jgi:hypothetical protein
VRRYGRCKGGERVYDERPGNPEKNVTLVAVMSDEGLIADMTLPGGLNTPSFLAYLEKILLPQFWVGAIVVMDNLFVHHGEALESRIESVPEESEILISLLPGFISHRVVLVKNQSNSLL